MSHDMRRKAFYFPAKFVFAVVAVVVDGGDGEENVEVDNVLSRESGIEIAEYDRSYCALRYFPRFGTTPLSVAMAAAAAAVATDNYAY